MQTCIIRSKFYSRETFIQYTYIQQRYRSIFKNARLQLEDQSNLNAKLTYSIFELLFYASQNHIKLHTATLFPPPYARRNCISKTISLFQLYAVLCIEPIRILQNIAFYGNQQKVFNITILRCVCSYCNLMLIHIQVDLPHLRCKIMILNLLVFH